MQETLSDTFGGQGKKKNEVVGSGGRGAVEEFGRAGDVGGCGAPQGPSQRWGQLWVTAT